MFLVSVSVVVRNVLRLLENDVLIDPPTTHPNPPNVNKPKWHSFTYW